MRATITTLATTTPAAAARGAAVPARVIRASDKVVAVEEARPPTSPAAITPRAGPCVFTSQ